MSEDKRKSGNPVPDDVANYLNEAQQAVLHRIEGFGWSIKYIRRPLFLEPVVVVTSSDGSSIGILEEDGRLNMEPEIETRE